MRTLRSGIRTRQGASSNTPPKKWTRSQSPRAKEKRRQVYTISMFGYVLCLDGSQDRQQNLTAQRNHRKLGATRPKSIRELTRIGVPGRRLKEQSQSASSEHSSDSHELQEPSLISSYPSTAPSATKSLPTFSPILQSQFMDDTTMGDDITVKSMLPWTTYDSMISEMPLSTSTDFSNYPMSQGCTCNGVTGPCARHMDEIRYQTLNTNMSAPSQFMSPFPESHVRSVYEGNNAGEFKMQQQQQPQVTLHHQPSDHSFSASISSTPSKSVTSVINLYESTFLTCVALGTIKSTTPARAIAKATAAKAAVLPVSQPPLH